MAIPSGSTSGAYTFHDFAADARAVADALTERSGKRPAVIGASLGGIASLLAEGAAENQGRNVFSALVLVDITPRVDLAGVDKVQGFMRAHAKEGFASIAEAADAVAEYLPHRPRPRSHEGLKKNLRMQPDGRWRWHWDPRFMESRGPSIDRRRGRASARGGAPPENSGAAGARRIVRTGAGGARASFWTWCRMQNYADVSGARHMVAGDRNDSSARPFWTSYRAVICLND